MKKTLLGISFLSLLGSFIGCSTQNNYSIQKNILPFISYSDKNTQEIYLSNIKIYQTKYSLKEGTLYYDDASSLSQYGFRSNAKELIQILFETNSYTLLESKANLYFFKLQNATQSFYLLLNKESKRHIELLYGFDAKSYKALLEAIQRDDKAIQVELKAVSRDLEPIRWSEKMIIIDNLVNRKH
jgi:hypothetical protein